MQQPEEEIRMSTPQKVEDFTLDWIKPIILKYFEEKKAKDVTKIELVEVKAQKNSLQGILSTTYVVDIIYKDQNPITGSTKDDLYRLVHVLKRDRPYFFYQRVWRHHRERFVFNVEMYWHLYTVHLLLWIRSTWASSGQLTSHYIKSKQKCKVLWIILQLQIAF